MQSPRAKSPAPPPREASPPPAQVPFNARRSLSLLLFDQVPQAAAKKAKTPSKKDTQAASSEVSRAPALCTRVNSHRPSAAIPLIPSSQKPAAPKIAAQDTSSVLAALYWTGFTLGFNFL